MKEAFICSSRRTAVGKAVKGTLARERPDDYAAVVMQKVLADAPGLDPAEIGDVIMGCAMPEAEQGMNVARIAAARAGLPVDVPAMTINRFCASGLEAVALAAARIRTGQAEAVLAGGLESMSLIPMGGHKVAPNPWLVDHAPESYISMGLTAEVVASRYGIGREQQDRFALDSHKKACAAIAEGKFKEEIVPVTVVSGSYDARGRKVESETVFDTDEGPRADTSLEALAKLKPAFAMKGTATAGNSSQMSDGAAAALLVSEDRVRALGLKPLGRLVSYAVAGVAPDEMGMGPVAAVPRALRQAGLSPRDIDLIELNEAFASQSLAVIAKLELDEAKVNVNGGAIALGHPLGCTGAKLLATILRELARRKARYGLVTMCVGGGMGAAGVIERL